MSRPTAYEKSTSFASYARSNPSSPYNAPNHDTEFDNIALALGQTQAALSVITRSDGKLLNKSVRAETLSNDAIALITGASFSPKGDWVTATSYVAGDMVIYNDAAYVCLLAHAAGTFINDLTAAYWQLWANNAITGVPSDVDVWSGDAVTTDFTLSITLNDPAEVMVFVDGKIKIPTTEYTLISSGTKVQFLSAPPLGTNNVVGLILPGAYAANSAASSAAAAAASAAAIASGSQTVTNLVCTGGTINGTTIGATTRAAISGTSGDFNAGLTVSGAAFTSRGITDNATATALTLSGSGANRVTIANSASSPTIGTSASALNINPASHIVNVGAGAANFLVCYGHASGAPGIQPGSAASDVSLSIFSKGTGAVNIGGAAGTSDYLTIYSSTGYAGISAGGASSDVQLSLAAKGTSGIAMMTAGSLTQVFVAHTASAVRYLTLTGAAAGGTPTIGTNAGSLSFAPGGTTGFRISLGAGNSYVQAESSTDAAGLRVVGGTNSVFSLYSVGTGSIFLSSHGDSTPRVQVAITATASADRYITLTGSNGGNPTIGVSGGSLAVSCPMVVSPGTGNTFSVNSGYVDFLGRLNVLSGQALPAGGSASIGIQATTSNIGIYFGSGAPTLSAAQGSIYIRSDGGASTRLYSNNNGSTGWSAITSA